MTKQEYFDLLVATSKAGGFPSVDDEGCVYRGENGRKCAVGLLIPDEKYVPSMERKIVTNRFTNKPTRLFENAVCVPDGMTWLDLTKVQIVHDDYEGSTWDHADFVARLLDLECFSDVVRPAA